MKLLNMEKFLSDYGLKWKNNEKEGNFDIDAVKNDIVQKKQK